MKQQKQRKKEEKSEADRKKENNNSPLPPAKKRGQREAKGEPIIYANLVLPVESESTFSPVTECRPQTRWSYNLTAIKPNSAKPHLPVGFHPTQ